MVNFKNPHLNASARFPTMGTHGGDGMSSHGLAVSIVLAAEAVAPLREEDHSLVVLAVVVVDQHALLPVGDLEGMVQVQGW